ncbi:hypothetical protein HOLleu_03274 [Holothuria leucospilota]|uniref:Uncharacterized protein n=1 Tax=Holothuria leucospilota TaxID=206669 RepID=A0A9Q1HLR4_HOLLE|nr:hypothetical protein HOLleu_03274 [Holothuria leucospilota]
MKYVKVIDSQAADQGILSCFREKCTNIKDSDELNDLRCLATLITLPCFLKEKIEHLLVLENDNETGALEANLKPAGPEPLIICQGKDFFNVKSVSLKVENEVICTTETLLEAYGCLMAAYYVFDLNFPRRSKNTLTLLDLLLGIKTKRLPRTICSFLTRYTDL